jgi:hypothetical protein
MIETLVAVLILGLVVTASLKLVALSQRGLREAREREALLRDASILQVRVSMNPLDLFGTSGDLSWNVSEKSSPLFADGGIDIASLGFSDDAGGESGTLNTGTKNWREIAVTRNGKSVTMFLLKPGETVSSGDKL